jgi:hypothetical protein
MSIAEANDPFELSNVAELESRTYQEVLGQDQCASQAMQALNRGEFFDAAVSSLGEAEAAKALNDSEAAKQALKMVGILIGKDIEVTAAEIELLDLPTVADGSSLLEVPTFIKQAAKAKDGYLVATSRDFLYPSKVQDEVRLFHATEELSVNLEEEIYSKTQAELIHRTVAIACAIIKQSTPAYQDEMFELLKFAYKAAEFHEFGEDPECDAIAYDSYLALIRGCRSVGSLEVAPFVYEAGEKLLDIAHYHNEDDPYPKNSKAEVLSALHYLRGFSRLNKKEYKSKSLHLLTKYPPIDWSLISHLVEQF